MSNEPVYCECLKIVTSLRECPVHGMFATASRRVELEHEVERLRKEWQGERACATKHTEAIERLEAEVERLRAALDNAS